MRLIEADALIEALDSFILDETTDVHGDTVREILERLPTIEERKTGKWTEGSDMPPMKHRNGKPKKFWPSFRYCSVCGREAFDDSDWGEQLFDFCPYCGADMRGEWDG